jgi:hypothetical protein
VALVPLLAHDGLELAADPVSGCVVSLRFDGVELLDPSAPPRELLVNGAALDLRAAPHTWTNIEPYPQCVVGPAVNEMHGCRFTGHYTGWGLDVTRALRANGPGRLDLSWTVQREKVRTLPECPGPGWGCIEAPLQVEAMTVPAWNWRLWGEQTRMIAYNCGNAGPRQHLSWENGPVAEVKRWCDTPFRRQYSGDLGLPGVVFRDVASGRWLALLCRRPAIAYQLDHRGAGLGSAFAFLPDGLWPLHHAESLPQVTLHWGRDQESLDRFLASQFSRFVEEPPAWFGRTLWHELDVTPERFRDWRAVHAATCELTAAGGVTGVVFIAHQRNWAWGGTSPESLAPTHDLGPPEEFAAMVRDLKSRGVRAAIWLSTCGMSPSGEADPDWFCRGIDGDLLPAWGVPHHPDIGAINLNHPGWQAYIERWLRWYLGDLGMDAAFFDCAGFAYPHDYTPRSWQRHASDSLLGPVRFFDHVREVLRQLGPDKVLIGEGPSLETRCQVLLKCGNNRGADGLGCRDVLLRNHRLGGRRIHLKSGIEGDVACGMAMCETSGGTTAAIGGDPFNRALAALLRDHGAVAAEALPCGGGASIIGGHLVVPTPRGESIPPAALVPAPPGEPLVQGIRVQLPAVLTDVITGARSVPGPDGSHIFRSHGIHRIDEGNKP